MKHYRFVVQGRETKWYVCDNVGRKLMLMAAARLLELNQAFAIEYAIL